MDKSELDQAVKMMQSQNDADAVMGLRALQGKLRAEGVDFALAMTALVTHAQKLKSTGDRMIDHAPVESVKAPVEISGMPQCISLRAGTLEILLPGATGGQTVALPGLAAEHSADIALHMKDALVAAAINKSRFKLKLVDVKNGKGEIVETILQAEYERDGMTPVRVWGNVRGEVAALATVLRRAVANALPDFVAA